MNNNIARYISMVMIAVIAVLVTVFFIIPAFRGNGLFQTDSNETSSLETSTDDSSASEQSSETSATNETETTTTETTTETTATPMETTQEQPSTDQTPVPTETPANTVDLNAIDNTAYNFGYAEANRDENMIPTDWKWYDNQWSSSTYNVDWIQDISSNNIYLTMDEGFGNDYTITILDILKEKGVNVTFFLTKYFADDRPELVQRMLDEGHQLGNHTCTHPNMPSIGMEQETEQIMTLHNQILDQFGYEMKLFRFPQGTYSAQSMALVDSLGYKSVFWTYAYNDYDTENQPDVDTSLAAAVNHLHPGAIYLLHANSSTNTAFLADFIDQARAKGFTFAQYPLSHN